MRPNITIAIPMPYLPLAEYCRLAGMNLSTGRAMVKDGRLPIKSKGNKSNGLVEVNMAALTVRALSESNISLNVQ